LDSLHRIKVLGRELKVRSISSAESVREVEAFVNERLAEVAASVNSTDPQIVAILTLMNITESYLALARENDTFRQQGNERISRMLNLLEKNLE
jgi:cell division protein ZapA